MKTVFNAIRHECIARLGVVRRRRQFHSSPPKQRYRSEVDLVRALRLASSSANGANDRAADEALSLKIIEEFLACISQCPSCDGTGTIPVEGEAIQVCTGYGFRQPDTYQPGTSMPCPTCLGSTYDPKHTRWECQVSEHRPCESLTGADEEHAACGFRVSLPLTVDAGVEETRDDPRA